jgi:hypothetical protein
MFNLLWPKWYKKTAQLDMFSTETHFGLVSAQNWVWSLRRRIIKNLTHSGYSWEENDAY